MLTHFATPLASFLVAALASAALCVLLRPLLVRYALARPNARSSHRVPTPQGGGIAVLAGVCIALAIAAPALPEAQIAPLLPTLGAAMLLAFVGAWDDIRPLPASLRILLQGVGVAIVVMFAVPDFRLFGDPMPLWAERALVLLAGVWFVNLVNFMDGLDWITVAGLVPLAATLALAGHLGLLDSGSVLLAAALCGGLAGFAPFNRPVARLFLGDVGSLPIGLIVAYLLYRLGGTGALVAAIILPLYHIADATITLFKRLARGEKVWEAHRSHFYQQATTNGFSVMQVVTRVFVLNLLLAALAALAVGRPIALQIACLALACAATGVLLRRFAKGPLG